MAAADALLERQLLAVTATLQLERRARHAATLAELGFLIVNDCFSVVRYAQAMLWRAGGGVLAVSGVATPDPESAFMVWIARLAAGRGDAAHDFRAADVPPALARDWSAHLPAQALWLPLRAPDGDILGALLLARDEPWTAHERHVLDYIADAFGHAWFALERRRRVWSPPKPRRLALAAGALALVAAAAVIPIRQSALAPAEIVPSAPVVIRAPLDGVIDHLAVRPNQPVAVGDTLFALDDRRLRNRLEVARDALAAADAEYRQAAQGAVGGAKPKTSLAVLKGRIDQYRAETDYVETLLGRIDQRAPIAGVAVFDDVDGWIGRPVTQGERVMMIADPHRTELEIHLPVGDALALAPGDEVRLFLNVAPDHVIAARLSFVSYDASPTPDGVLAYRLRAEFAGPDDSIRLGQKGIAKIYGPPSGLLRVILRRPLAAFRQYLGL